MNALFLRILNLAINASWLIIAVIAARIFLNKSPKWISCLLWGLVAVRLLCPVSLESALSLLPSGKVIPENIEMVKDPHIESGVRIIDNTVNPVLSNSFSPDVASSVNPMQVAVSLGGVIWLIGMAAMLAYALISFILLKRKVRASFEVNSRIRECDEVESPFILGMLRPMIYIPSGMPDETIPMVIAHEEAHLKRRDHWWKPLGFVLLSVYWFHPLCWVAYTLLCRDIEAACDEKVIRDKDRKYRAAYSQALLDCNVGRRIISVCPLAFGETGPKERVKTVLKYKKPAFWVILVSILACVVVALCFMTNPKNLDYDPEASVSSGSEAEDAAQDHAAEGQNSVDIKRPEVNLSGTEGADLTEILYADKDKIIFSGYYGLFVYSKKQRTITNAIDLEPVGCNYTQGDNACEKFVSADGNLVYLHPINNPDMFVYNIEADNMRRERYNLEEHDLHSVSGETGSYSKGDCDAWRTEDHDYLTLLHHGRMIGELCYTDVFRDADPANIQWYPLFSPEGLAGAVDFSPEDIHDIVSADIWVAGELSHMPGVFALPEGGSRRLHCVDPAVLKELEKMLSGATKEKLQGGCPFYTALYLTRKDGTIGTVFPATDSCDTYNSGMACYRMADGTNEKLWGLINGFQETDTAGNMGVEYTLENGSYVVDEDMAFQYKVELIGRTPNARYDTRYIVLTNDQDITFEKVDRSIYSSDSSDWLSDTIIIDMQTIDENGNTVPTNPIGLTMDTENVSSKGCTLVFTQSGGNVTGELLTGEAFFLQVCNRDGKWEDISTPESLGWNDIAINISNGGKTEIEINWEYAYGELNTGHYRIKKEVMDFRKTADYDEYDIYAEFDISN